MSDGATQRPGEPAAADAGDAGKSGAGTGAARERGGGNGGAGDGAAGKRLAARRVPLLPRALDNDFRGSRVALWAFVALTAVTLVRSVIHLVAPDGGAQSIATVPLDAFTPNGSATVIHLFALWGLSQLIVAVVYVVSLVRYRALIPLLYLLALVEYVVRLGLTFWKPFQVAETAPGAVGNYVLIPVLALLFVLSLVPTRTRQRR